MDRWLPSGIQADGAHGMITAVGIIASPAISTYYNEPAGGCPPFLRSALEALLRRLR